MIRHIIFFGLKDQKDLQQVKKDLEILADIDEAKLLEVRVNLKRDQFDNEVDLVVYAEFEDEASLLRYQQHPIYAESIRRVRPLRNARYSADTFI